MPKISVIVPVYKVEKYLSRCVDSILRQSFIDFELILVDDGSPDLCGDICEQYAASDNRVIVIHRENGGLSAARNSGIEWSLKNSDSEWITFIDSDDWLHPDYLMILLDCAKKFNTYISVCNFLRASDYSINPVIKENLKVRKYLTEDFFINFNLNAVIACGKLYKKNFFKNIRYPEGKLHEDEFTTYKILFECKEVCFVDEELYYYFVNETGITGGTILGEWRPSRMDFIEAVQERLVYFKERNINSVYMWQLKQYLYYLCEYCRALSETENQEYKKKYLLYFRRELRRFIKENKKLMDLSFKKEKWIYELAYPRLTHLYWVTVGRLNNKQ